MVPRAGMSYAKGISKTTSGFGMAQPDVNCAGAGISLGSPSGAPPSAHVRMVSMSPCGNDRSLENFPKCGSANHGGITLKLTASFMAAAHGLVSAYVSIEKGAASP